MPLHAVCAALNLGELPTLRGTTIATFVPPPDVDTWGSGKFDTPWLRMQAA
jgi:hypothetical protein